MDAKKKTKIWIIVFLSTLGVAGILATLIGQKNQLFKGFGGVEFPNITRAAICGAQSNATNCASAGCVWSRVAVPGQSQCTPGSAAGSDPAIKMYPDPLAKPNLEITSDEQLLSQVITAEKNVITAGTKRVIGSFNFKNTSNQLLNINSIKVTISGPNPSAHSLDINKMHHFIFVKDLSVGKLDDVNPGLAPSLASIGFIEPNSGSVTWHNNFGDLFTIAAGTSVRVSLIASIDSDAPAGKTIGLQILNKTDVIASPEPNIVGSFPVNGGDFNIQENSNTPDLRANIPVFANIAAGNLVSFSGNVSNIGTAATVPNFAVRFCIDNVNCVSNTTGRLGVTDSIYAAALQPNASQIMSSGSWTAIVGPHSVVFCVDVTNMVVPELTEDNNCHTQTFTVNPAAAPGATVTFSLDPSSPVLGAAERGATDKITTVLKLTSSGGAIDITQLKFTRGGLGAAADITSIQLFEESNPRGTASLIGNIATFDLSSQAIHMANGSTKILTLRVNVAPSAVLANSFKLGIAAAADVTVEAEQTVAANPSFPLYGNTFTIGSVGPPPPSLDVTVGAAEGQSSTIPAITNQSIKLFTINLTMSGGNLLIDRLKKIVLEYQNTSALEISKITDLHLFRGDSTEFTVGATNKDLISLNKNATNGTIEIVFQTAGPTTLLADPRNQHLTLRAKINASQGDDGKKIAYILRSVEVEPPDASKIGLAISTPEFSVHEDPPDAPTATFQAAPASMNRGQSTTLTWTVTGATTMSIDQGIGNIQGTGSRTVNPTTDTTYTLTATNAGGTITRTVAIAVAQPAAQTTNTTTTTTTTGTTTALVPQTCEQQGLHTYTGQPKPGERVTGMCIPCTTEKYIAGAGSCEVKKKKKSGGAVDRAFEPPDGTQQATTNTSSGAAAGQRPAAAEPSPNLQGSQRLVRAPEKANTGPETLVYIGILGVVHAGLWLRRRMKR